MAMPPRPLLPEEVPLELRPYFDFTDQERWRRKKKNSHGSRVIRRRCIECGKAEWLQVSGFRERLRTRGTITARCRRCSGRAQGQTCVGPAHPNWGGGRFIDPDGYVRVRGKPQPVHKPYHHEHRVVMEQMLGRPLRSGETVHHKNGIRDDNRPENLELWQGGHPKGVRVADQHCPGCRCGVQAEDMREGEGEC